MNGFRFVALSSVLVITLAACGGSDDGESEPRPTNSPLPQFEEVVPPTEPPELATAAAATLQARKEAETEPDPTAVARGQTNWDRLECATCHGTNGEGGAGQINGVTAPPLVNLALTEGAFIDWMRSGGRWAAPTSILPTVSATAAAVTCTNTFYRWDNDQTPPTTAYQCRCLDCVRYRPVNGIEYWPVPAGTGYR